MAKTIIVCGYGPGISNAVAERFGKEGFQVALVARNAERLDAAAKRLSALGVRVEPFATDLGRPDAARALVKQVRDKLGGVSAIHWNAYDGSAGDLLAADTNAVHAAFDIAVTSLLAAVQEALPELRRDKGAVLVTNGGLGIVDEKIDAMAVSWNAMGLALANAAKHKLVALLAQKLKPDGVYVGEVMVTGIIKGSAFDQGNGNVEASTVSNKFWELYDKRTATFVSV